MIKALLDTNIVVDFALKRAPFYSGASKVFSLILSGKCEGFLTATTVTDVFYLLKKENGRDQTVEYLKSIFDFIDILSIDKDLILNALYSDWKDFEDAVQAQAAVENELDVIITRNTKDFKQNTTVRILTPDEFVEVVS